MAGYQNPDGLPDEIVAQLAPIAHAHINIRRVISFHLDIAAKGLPCLKKPVHFDKPLKS